MKQHAVMEHYLVPLNLVCLNIALIHLIYYVSAVELFPTIKTLILLTAVFLLLFALYVRKKWLLVGSIVFYTFILLISFY